MREAHHFYTKLYTPDPIEETAIDSLLYNVPPNVTLVSTQRSALVASLVMNDVVELINHSPLSKSPGIDGIPFEVYKYLLNASADFSALLLRVMQEAMDGEFPSSWKKTRMVLLFKKGDPELLQNWRPLSLINCDAKLFTKLIANRFNTVLPSLINPYQTGFMPSRLISDNGWLNSSLIGKFCPASIGYIQEFNLTALFFFI